MLLGIKTGYTNPAKNCLSASADKDGLKFLVIVLGGGTTEDGLSQRYLDTTSLFEYGYQNYSLIEVIKAGNIVHTVKIKNATKDTKNLNAVIGKDISVLIKRKNKDNVLLPEVSLKENLKAPIKKGEIIGSVKYSVEGIDYTADLLADNNVKQSKILIKCILVLCMIILLWLYLKSKNRRKKNSRLKMRVSR